MRGCPKSSTRPWSPGNLLDFHDPTTCRRARITRLKETGLSPARYMPAARVGCAKAWLQRAGRPLERIAERSGSGSVDALQRAFATCVGASPRDYRARFGQPRRANPKTSVSGNATRMAPAESCTMHRI
ncbi:helix-turn-helix domain-containing protein [Burkholderia cepacia]|nr:helix-turn-helix domain-containing protein [Burkholderia cepacia]RQT69910.1 helix-turn-helix domain-containing protein [Burkholderia cepacia]